MKVETILFMLIDENVVEGSIHVIQNFSEIMFSLALTLTIKNCTCLSF